MSENTTNPNANNFVNKITTRKKQFNGQGFDGLTLDKLPPQAREIEEIVLGSMLLSREATAQAIEILLPESFYVEAHQIIYQSMMDLFQKSQPIDVITVAEQLRKSNQIDNIGGAFYIAQLTNRVATTAHIETHARIIAEKFILRELIKTSNNIIKDAYEDASDVFEILDKAEQNLFAIAGKNLRKHIETMPNLVSIALKQLNSLKDHQDGLTGIPSGFANLDRITSGWQKSDLIVLAARPGMGKTAMVLTLARNAAVMHQKPVAVFSLEMSAIQLVNRLISSETEITSERLKRADLTTKEWDELTTKLEQLANAHIFIDDTPAINIFELRAKCRRLKMQHDIQLIVIDYLQLMSGTNSDGKSGNREQEISVISRSLKAIAKELDVPIIALSQLNRSVETRSTTDKRPHLSDLRESGSIEQDADMVIFLYRPEYYGFTEDENGDSTRGTAEIIIAKHRNGALETVKAKFMGQYAKFENLDTLQGEYISPNEELTPVSQIVTRQSKGWDEMNMDNNPPPPPTNNLTPDDEVPF